MKLLYCILMPILRAAMFFAHPVFRVSGRENVPEGRAVICCNHSNMSDPIWLLLGLKLKQMPAIMAKKELMEIPVLGAFLRLIGVIGVDRGNNDIHAIKASMRVLKNDEKLMIFPEGTRVHPGKDVEAKNGAAVLASRTNAPLVPVFLTRGKRFFAPLQMSIGKPFLVEQAGTKALPEEIQSATDRLMEEIYAMEEPK